MTTLERLALDAKWLTVEDVAARFTRANVYYRASSVEGVKVLGVATYISAAFSEVHDMLAEYPQHFTPGLAFFIREYTNSNADFNLPRRVLSFLSSCTIDPNDSIREPAHSF